jgi:hypothetical protein
MGYDLHMAERPAAVPEGYVPQYEGQPEYFRVRAEPMKVLVALMAEADAVSLEPTPEFPRWPPPGLDEKRAAAIAAHRRDGGRLTPPLTIFEQAALRASEDALEAILRRPSAEPGRVPVYKFQSNDGWWVSPEECRGLDRSLRRFADELSDDVLAAVLAPFEAVQRREAEHYRRTQGFVPLGFESPILTTESAREWLREFAAYNALAAEHGGYHVR